MSTICRGNILVWAVTFLYLDVEAAISICGSLSGFKNVSITGRKSNIPTPALFGVVLNVPINALLLVKTIGSLLT